MRAFSRLLSVLCTTSFLATATGQNRQALWTQSLRHDSKASSHELPGDLSTLSTEGFARFSHPYFPYHSARIKKTEGFCDETVNTYTGYIDVGTRHLFFYFFESRNDPDTDDVMLWTNGGPGASSSTGLFMELGPCSIISPNTTRFNPYSWNSKANIFFIDQPVGVGLSYADFGEAVSTTEEAAKDIAAFVAMFFETFPKFKGRAFHLSGESYGGRYLPLFAAEIYDQNAKLIQAGLAPINLKSVLIGNGATDFRHLYSSYYDFQCSTQPFALPQTISACVRMKQALPRCLKWTEESCVTMWDQMNCAAAHAFCSNELSGPFQALGLNVYDASMSCNGIDCYNENKWLESFLNNKTIRDALGVDPLSGKFDWHSREVSGAFTKTGDRHHPTQLYVAELLHRGIRVLIYVGEYDFICNWIGNERWTLEMEWSGKESFVAQPLGEWYIANKAVGKLRSFGNLTFATVYGGGHLLPHDKPVESLEMLTRWLQGYEL